MNAHIIVLGLGNILMSDDGFGINVINYLKEHYVFPQNVELIDGGTSGILLEPYLRDADVAILVDTINLDSDTDKIYSFKYQDLVQKKISTHFSPHQVGIIETLQLIELTGKLPDDITFFCVIPANTSLNVGLSPRLEGKVKETADLIVTYLKDNYNIDIKYA